MADAADAASAYPLGMNRVQRLPLPPWRQHPSMRRPLILLLLVAVALVGWALMPANEGPESNPTPEAGSADEPAKAAPGLGLGASPTAEDAALSVVTGRVYRGGRPVAASLEVLLPGADGKLVSVFDTQAPRVTIEASAEEGFRWTPPGPGNFRIRTGTPPAIASVYVQVSAGNAPAPVAIVLPDGPHAVRVRVVDEAGQAVRAPTLAQGSAVGTGSPAPVLGPFAPDADGRFEVPGLEAGVIKFRLDLAGGATAGSYEVTVPRPDAVTLIVPKAERTVRVRVLDARGDKPVLEGTLRVDVMPPGAVVWRSASHKIETGAVKVLCPAGPGRLRIRATGYKFAGSDLRTGEDEALVRLTRLAHVSGRVVERGTTTPIARTHVHLYAMDEGEVATSLFRGGGSRETKADGTFELTEGRLTSAMVCVHGGGWVSPGMGALKDIGVNPFVLTDVLEQGRGIELEAVRASSLRVLVVDEAGQPVPNCPVEAAQVSWVPDPTESFHMGEGTPFTEEGTTDKDGAVHFDTLVPGWTYWLAVPYDSPWGLKDREFITIEAGQGELPQQQLVVEKNEDHDAEPEAVKPTVAPRGPLHVAVRDDAGRPLRGATVSAHARASGWSSLPTPRGLRTAADGTLVLEGLPDADVHIQATCFGYVTPARARVQPTGGRVTITMTKGLYITGVARHEDGRAVARASVHPTSIKEPWSRRNWGASTTWEGDGRFRVGPLLADDYKLDFDLKLAGRKHRGTVEASAGDTGVAVVLVPDPDKRGSGITVRGPDGSSVPSFLTLHLSASRSRVQTSLMYSTHRGHLRIPSPRRRLYIDIVQAAPGTSGTLPYGAKRLGPFEPGATFPLDDITLPHERTLEGRVVDDQGAAVAGVRVDAYAVPPDGWKRQRLAWSHAGTFTRLDGSFRLRRLGDLAYDLRVFAPRRLLEGVFYKLKGGTTGHTLTLRSASTVEVRVVDEAGRAVARAAVHARPTKVSPFTTLGESDMNPDTVKTDATGRVGLGRLDPRAVYDLYVDPPRERSDLRDRKVAGWTPADTSVPLEAKATSQGVVRDTQGRPLAGVRVRAQGWDTPSPTRWHRSRTQDDGTFTVRGFPAGRVRIVLRLPGFPDDVAREATAPASGVAFAVQVGTTLTLSAPSLRASIDDCRYTVVELPVDEAKPRVWKGQIQRGSHDVLRGVRADRAYAIHASCYDDGGYYVAHVPSVPAGTRAVSLTFEPAHRLVVRVQTPPGTSKGGVTLRIRQGGVRLQSRTSREGVGSFWNLPAGRYRVEAEKKTAQGLARGHADVETSGEGVIELTLGPRETK